MAVRLHLLGRTPPPPTACRVLELGCADGGNLIPMAVHHPGAIFVGLDLTGRLYEPGQWAIEELGLENISLIPAGLEDAAAFDGQFDYIIAHGVLSRLPDAAQNRLLDVAARLLAPAGAAYISYDAYPGWYGLRFTRDLMRFHAGFFNRPEDRTAQARAVVDFIVNTDAQEKSPHVAMLKSHRQSLSSLPPDAFQTFMETENAPVYFFQLAEKAAARGLAYMGDAVFSTGLPLGLSQEVADFYNQLLPNRIRAEQYLDFIQNRNHRRSLFCGPNGELDWSAGPGRLSGLLASADLRLIDGPLQLTPRRPHHFQGPEGRRLTAKSPMTKAGLAALMDAWPQAISVDELHEQARATVAEALGPEAGNHPDELLADLWLYHQADAVELHLGQADFVARVSDAPRLSDLAAFMIRHGSTVINQKHQSLGLAGLALETARLADGARSVDDIAAALIEQMETGRLTPKTPDGRDMPLETAKRFAPRDAAAALAEMAENALLVA